MLRILSFILFVLIATFIITSIHYYLWLRLIRDTGLNGGCKNFGAYLLVVLTISPPAAILISKFIPFKYSFPILWISFLWLGIMMLLFFYLFFTDIIKILFYGFYKFLDTDKDVVNHERRHLFSMFITSGFIASGASVLVASASYFGIKNYYKSAVVVKLKVLLSGLPEKFTGFKIVQISDLHIGQMMTTLKVKEIVDIVNSLKPDLIAITGDLVDGSVNKLLNEIMPLKNLKATKGIYFVTGNHEYYSGVESWLSEIKKMGITILYNENIKIKKGNEFIYLAGVTDREAKKFGAKHAADFNKTFSGMEKNKKKILLAHQPIDVKKASIYGTDLVLAGHTHGGHIWPFHYFVYLQQPYLKGLYEYNNTKLYVNQGTGCWGPPLRLGSFNEITEIILS